MLDNVRLKKMNVSSKAIDLYVSLAYICKVHGLTPHSSTGRCPFELIKLGSLPPLFPSLISDISQKSELTVTRHCADKLRKRKSFEEGDHVVVYDNHTKLSYDAVVSEVLGTNNYLVMSGNGPKHVSGDNMSRAATQPSAEAPPAPADDNTNDIVVVDDDNLSVISEESVDLELPIAHNNVYNNVNNAVNNRRGRRELNNLGPVQNLPRLRSQHR